MTGLAADHGRMMSIKTAEMTSWPSWLVSAIDDRMKKKGDLVGTYKAIGLVARYSESSFWVDLCKVWWSELTIDQQDNLVAAFEFQVRKTEAAYKRMDAKKLFNQLYMEQPIDEAFRTEFLIKLFQIREDMENLAWVLKTNGEYTDAHRRAAEKADEAGSCRITQFGEIICAASDWLPEWRLALNQLDWRAWWAFQDDVDG